MKRLIMMFLALASLATTAMAQAEIEKVAKQIASGSLCELSDINVSSDYDENGKQCKYEYYSFLLKKNSNSFKSLTDAFRADRHDAYDMFRKMADKNGDKDYKETIAYGKDLARSITFGGHLNRNYEVLLFRDKDDNAYRTAYVLIWYDEGEDTRCLFYRIYSKNPREDNRKTNHNVTYGSDGSIIIYDGNTNNSTVLRDWPEKIALGDNDILDATDFMVAFNKIVASIKRMQTIISNAKNDILNDRMAEPVNNMLILCKRHSKLLNADERTACSNSIDDIIKSSADANTTEMLKLAKSYLGK